MNNGDIYEGLFVKSLWDGKGTLTEGKTKYVGDFLKGQKHGEGIKTYGNGYSYDGSWEFNNY